MFAGKVPPGTFPLLDNSNTSQSKECKGSKSRPFREFVEGFGMAYNFSLKRYANGTFQLTYYDYPILNSDDVCKRYSDRDYEFFDSDEITPWGDVIKGEFEDDEVEVSENISEEDLKRFHERSVRNSINRTKKKIYDLGRNNIWEWFVTFTLNEQSVENRYDYCECSKKVCTWFNNIRKRMCSHIKYLIVPEKHPTSGAWHFHALVSNCSELDFEIAINNQEFRKDEYGELILDKNGQPKRNKYFGQELRVSYPNGNYIYNITNFNEKRYGFTTATKIIDTRKAVSYIVKYLTKDLVEYTIGKKRYFASMNLQLPERILLGDDKHDINEVVEWIESEYHVTLQTDYIKSVTVGGAGYHNTVSYMEFQ